MEPPVPRPARALPATIGRYRVIGRLGKGAMAIVYRAYDDVMERPVAIKVMMADLQDDPEMSARFYREAHAAGQLMHRNIITIFDMGDDDGRPYIVMELLEGKTLGDYVERSDGILLEDKISLITQVFEGLRPAHSKGIFHRDIKPGNLLVHEDGSLKIVDFGIARLMTSSMTVSGLIVGTPDYMSPEQACGREVDQRSDIFSTGAVFYYMLTKRKPFAASDLPAVLVKVQNEQPLPIRDSEAPPALAKVVMKALEKSPADRYQDAGEAIADLARVSRALALEARHAEEQARSQRAAASELADEAFKLCNQLEIAPIQADIDRFDEDIRKRHPAYGDWLDGQTGEPLRHAAAHDVLRAVSAMCETLTGEVDLLRHAVSNLERGESTANAGDLASALSHFEATLKAVPACGRAQDAANRIRSLLAQKRAAEDHARALLIEANDAAGRAEWQAVLALTAEALSADRTNADAALLRDRANKALESQAQERRRQSEQALKRAEKLARKQRYAEAEQAARDARQFDPDSRVALELEERFRTARLDEERASASARRSAEAIALARRKFDNGARTEALSDLRAFLEREPQSPSASAALETLTAEAERLLADERRRQQAAEQAKSAEIALQSDDPDRALALAQGALAIDGSEPLAKNVQRMATARLRERVLAAERKAAGERMVETAKGLLSRGQYAAARREARSAANLLPAEAGPLALLALIEEAELKWREQEQRELDARRRANATAPVIAMARAAETSQDFVRAGWLAENALALDPDCAEAREIVDRARTKVAADPGLADETVTGADQNTLIINPAPPFWRRIVETLRNWWTVAMALAAKWRGASEPRVKQS